jgi:sugar phosphate isomerase/epimerase
MLLGLSSYTYGWAVADPHRPLDEQTLLDRTIRFGLRVLQFGDNLPLHALPAERLAALKTRAEATGIRLEAGARGLRPEYLRRYVELAGWLGAPLLRFVIDEKGYEPPLTEVVAVIRDALPLLRQHGVTLGIENHDRFRAADLARLMETLADERVGICLDCANSLGAGEGLAWVVDRLAPHAVNFHVKDFGITRLPHLMGFLVEGRPAGQGMLDLPWVLGQLARYGRCPSAVLELWPPPEPDPAATLAKEARWVEESVQYLKGYF